MTWFKCSKCGFTLEIDSPPEQCPSCKESCVFIDNTCYTRIVVVQETLIPNKGI